MRTLLTFCQSQEAWLLETIETLARLESPSTDKAAVDRCGAELERRLAGLGGRVVRLARHDAGDLLRAEFGSGPSQVLLLGHFDTVWSVGQLGRMPIRQEDGRLYGPGVYDMKAGIAIGILAIRAVQETGRDPGRRIVLLLTTDEEIGSRASKGVIEAEARASGAVFVLEPSLPGGAVKTSRKGCGDFRILVTGRSGHAGVDPGQGASAIHELARLIVELQALQDLSRGVSVNVGTVAGGIRPNVIAEEARAEVDVRAPTMADAGWIESAIRALTTRIPGTSIAIEGGFERPPLERRPGVVRLYEQARRLARELGRELGEGGTGGGSDGNFTAALGVPTLDGLGAVGDGAHALDEHIVVGELGWRAALVAGLIGSRDPG